MGTATSFAPAIFIFFWKHFIPLWGQQPLDLVVVQERLGNISYPYGDSNRIVGGRGASDGKHFIPLWGQQHLRGRHGRHSGRNISYPYGDSNVEDAATAVIAVETFRSPMGTATGHAGPASKKRRETFHTPTGTATTGMPVASASCCETFHTPSGTKRKPICPIRHIGFYFIRSCYSHVTPPIPSAVLMPTPAYGAKCSSRFAIVR